MSTTSKNVFDTSDAEPGSDALFRQFPEFRTCAVSDFLTLKMGSLDLINSQACVSVSIFCYFALLVLHISERNVVASVQYIYLTAEAGSYFTSLDLTYKTYGHFVKFNA